MSVSLLKNYLTKLALFALLLFVDLFSKDFIHQQNQDFHLGLLKFQLVKNPGIFLGHFQNLDFQWRIIGLCTIYGILLFFYFLLATIINDKAKGVHWGLFFFFTGVTGNFLDRLRFNYVVDFIRCLDYAYNIADVMIVIGMGLIVIYSFVEMDLIWYPDDLRKKYIIDQEYQLKYAFKLFLFSLFSSFILGIFSYKFLEFVISKIGSLLYAASYLNAFLNVYIFLSFFFAICVFLAGIYYGHRSAGAIFSFERYILQLLEGEDPKTFGLRKNDNHRNLEILAHKLALKINQKYSVTKEE